MEFLIVRSNKNNSRFNFIKAEWHDGEVQAVVLEEEISFDYAVALKEEYDVIFGTVN